MTNSNHNYKLQWVNIERHRHSMWKVPGGLHSPTSPVCSWPTTIYLYYHYNNTASYIVLLLNKLLRVLKLRLHI